ncbi:TonB-dependent receptor [Pseudofulvibacter geojedonensis]|uniref:TonB-dependent receptor domain-containing protein n=1 Tax=Pseudofulvibacter geojedonensis TaxID=1123758 RepID=A0ABW3I556_9FLAO
MSKYFLCILFALIFSISFAQHDSSKKHQIKGTITSLNKPLAYVNVYLQGTSIGVITDENGNYSLSVNHGDYILVAQAIGYSIEKKSIHIDGPSTYNFDLKEDVLGLDQVVISATKTSLNRKEAPVLVTVTSAKDLEQINATSLIDGLTFQPGLRTETNCQNCGFSQIRINGLDGAYSQILVNSRPIFSSLNGIYGLEQIPSNMIEQIEVTRGGGSAIFGANAIAGTINIITKDPEQNGYQVNSKLNWIDGKAPESVLSFNSTNVSKDLNKGITFYGMYRHRKNYDANNDGFSELPKLNNINFGLKSFYNFNDRKKLTAEFTTLQEFRRGGDQLDLPAHEVLTAEEIKNRIVGGGLTYEYYSPSEKNKISLYSNTQSTLSNNYYGANQDPDGYGITEDITFLSGFQHSYKVNEFIGGSMKLTSGVEYNFNKITEDRRNALVDFFKQETNTLGIFTQADWKIRKNLKVLTGVRGEYFESNFRNKSLFILNPRVSVLYNITKDLSFRSGYSQGFRAPQFFSEDVHSEIITGEIRNVALADNLKEEKSHSFIGSLEYSHKHDDHQFLATLEGFFTRINNPFVYEDRGVDGNGLLLKEKINGDRATVNGINIEVKYSPNPKYSIQLGGTAQNSYYENYFEPEDGISTNKILRTPQLYGNALINYTPNKKWDFNLSSVLTGKMYVPHVEGYITETRLEETPTMVDVGFNTGYTIRLDHKNDIKLTSGIKNIFNSYQDDFDKGVDRDPNYVYGPSQPRTFYIGVKFGTNL